MARELSQNTQLRQSLGINAQMRDSLDVLQAPSLELRELLRHKLESNPALEEIAPDFSAPSSPDTEEGNEAYDGDDYDYSYDYLPQKKSDKDASETYDFLVNSIEYKSTLREELVNQAACDCKDESVVKAFIELCNHLDSRGFLPLGIAETLTADGFTSEQINEALELLKSMEPAGIGASDLRECFLLQLERLDLHDSLAYEIVDEHYDLFVKRKVADLAEKCATTPAKIENAFNVLAKLHTSPAREYEQEEATHIWPDARIYKAKDGSLKCEVLDTFLPRLKISDDYRDMLAKGELEGEGKSYIKEKISEAKALVSSLQERKNTILRITELILKKQKAFFEGGNLQPMTMTNIAEELGINPSTVSRALSGKYLEIPNAIKPYEFFFSTAVSKNGESALSNNSVKEEIKRIIESENPKKPYSDSEICEILAESSINIARRTAAKYREELGIPVKTLRKRFS